MDRESSGDDYPISITADLYRKTNLGRVIQTRQARNRPTISEAIFVATATEMATGVGTARAAVRNDASNS